MGKIKNLSLRKTIVLYMIISLIISFYLSALIMRIASTVQNNIWWNYVDQEEYFEMAEGDGRRYLPDVPRPHTVAIYSCYEYIFIFLRILRINSVTTRLSPSASYPPIFS